MSLITAKIVGDLIYCAGDTKITYANNGKTHPLLNGSLKQYIFNDLLVCFAGCVHSFEQDIEKYRNCTKINEVVDIATKNATKYEILVASSNPCQIIIIKDRTAKEATAGFIGDVEAFEAYQKYYHEPQTYIHQLGTGEISIFQVPEPPSEGDDYARMYRAIKEVSADSNISSVGGAVITIATHKGRFQYMMYCDIFTDEVVIPEPGESRSIGFGTKEGGGYSVEFSACNEHKGLALRPAYYFLQGGFGVVFPEKLNSVSNAQFVRAENPCQWALATRVLLGEAVISGYLSLDHCGIAAENYIAKGDFLSALECYKLRLDTANKGTENRAKLDRYYSGYYVCLFNTNSQARALSEISDLIANNPDFSGCKHHLYEMEKTL